MSIIIEKNTSVYRWTKKWKEKIGCNRFSLEMEQQEVEEFDEKIRLLVIDNDVRCSYFDGTPWFLV